MLPSMPILFTRESQDAFGNKIEPSTSFFNQNLFGKPEIRPEPPPSKTVQQPAKATTKENKGKAKKKDQTKEGPPKISESALEIALVKSYYTKVQSRFSPHLNVPTNKFLQFQSILKSFDPTKENPVDLYRKIEELFGEEHKDIVEEFLLFLKRGQAAQVGRFMDHFALSHMTEFIELLQTTLARKPTVLRKVVRALTAGINGGNEDEMKSRVLPHLRSNPRLTQMFKSLFPDERPPDSLYESGTDVVSESFLTDDKGYDVWEFEEAGSTTRKLENKDSLDTVYLHGRVFLQHGRILRSARVTYPYSKEPYRVHARRLAPNHSHPSPPASDDERASPKRHNKTPKAPPKRTKKQLKSPTKAVKDVNDNTNKECVNNSKRKKNRPKKDDKSDKKKANLKKDDTAKAKNKDITNETQEVPNTEISNTEIPNTEVPNTEVKNANGSWTRDEDKTMLQVLKGEAASDEIFVKISAMLPHRSVFEIKERFFHVMTLLQQMAVGEVP